MKKNKNKTLIIVIVSIALIVFIYFAFFHKKNTPVTGVSDSGSPQNASSGISFDLGSLFKRKDKSTDEKTTTTTPKAPSNALLSGFDEGERLRQDGHVWEVVNGSWAYISPA